MEYKKCWHPISRRVGARRKRNLDTHTHGTTRRFSNIAVDGCYFGWQTSRSTLGRSIIVAGADVRLKQRTNKTRADIKIVHDCCIINKRYYQELSGVRYGRRGQLLIEMR